MKKLMMCLAGTMMALSLAACTPTDVTNVTEAAKVTESAEEADATNKDETTSQDTKRNPEGITPEMVAESNAAIKREADKTAPVYEMALIYVPNSDSAKLVQERADLENITEQTLVDCLAERGVFEEGTAVNSFSIEGEEKAGPGTGTDASGSGERIGILDLSKTVDPKMLNAIANTFIDNYELDKLKLLVNGENYESGDTVQGDEDYLEFTDDYQES